MASINGILSPSAQPDSTDPSATLSTKRKRDDSIEVENHVNGITDSTNGETTGPSAEESQSVIRDLIDVLQSQDTTPSVLTRSIPNRAPSVEPQAKRQKGEESSETTTIMMRYTANTYKNVDEVLRDIDTAVSDIKDMLQPLNSISRHQQVPESEISMKVVAFKERAHTLVRRERTSRDKQASRVNGNIASFTANGNPGTNAVAQINANLGANKTVLTLYGNAPGPKQLFSSYQIPTKLDGENKQVLQSLREAGLPNGINTTQIVPIKTTGVSGDKKRVPTLGELFPTPPSVPVMQPPKPSKVATTRSSTVGWYQPATADPPPRNASYFRQSISSGLWLDYTNAAPPQDVKRRHRDRAMSMGGSKTPQIDAEPESDAAKAEALFRSAYSGFAPTKDDSAAVASEGHMNRIWWQTIGEKSFERFIENASNFEEATIADAEPVEAFEELDIEKLEEMVNEMEQDPIDPTLVPLGAVVEKSAKEKDVEEILAGISELLETLNSYQRIRHMSLNSSSRPVGLLSAPDTSSLGTPSKPSEPEQATYEMLRTSLELMIATLPPYAVAKLDSDRLAELSISTKIEVQREDHKGVMEEDEAATRVKAALSASSSARAAAPASLHRSGSSTQLYGNQYTASRPAPAHQYYGGSHQTPIRPPSSNMQRPPATAQAPFQPHRPAPSPAPFRTSYGTSGYPHQSARPAQPNYPASNSQQYLHTPGAQPYMRPAGQNYQQQVPQSAPQGPMNGGFPRQPSYQQHTQTPQNGMNYQYGNSSNVPRQSSPQKMYSPQQGTAQHRPYGTPTPVSAGPTRAPSYPQNSMAQSALNGTPSQTPTPQPAFPRPTGPTNYSTFLSTTEQANMMERQRAQLAQQQGMQQQARNAAQAAMGSPSTTQVNGNSVAVGL